jgi:hypothetical protein
MHGELPISSNIRSLAVADVERRVAVPAALAERFSFVVGDPSAMHTSSPVG